MLKTCWLLLLLALPGLLLPEGLTVCLCRVVGPGVLPLDCTQCRRAQARQEADDGGCCAACRRRRRQSPAHDGVHSRAWRVGHGLPCCLHYVGTGERALRSNVSSSRDAAPGREHVPCLLASVRPAVPLLALLGRRPPPRPPDGAPPDGGAHPFPLRL